jgi:hypothetical protein
VIVVERLATSKHPRSQIGIYIYIYIYNVIIQVSMYKGMDLLYYALVIVLCLWHIYLRHACTCIRQTCIVPNALANLSDLHMLQDEIVQSSNDDEVTINIHHAYLDV